MGIKTIIYDTKTTIITDKKTTIPNEVSLWLIRTHIAIWLKKNYTIEKNSELAFIQELEQLALIDIIAGLELSKDKNKFIRDFLSKSDKVINKADIFITQLKQELNLLKSEMDYCNNAKANSDQRYFKSINQYNQIEMEEAIQESQKYWSCATENRIKFNAKTELLNKIIYYYNLLVNKYNFIETKQEIIIKHFDVIKWELLNELNQIKGDLNNF